MPNQYTNIAKQILNWHCLHECIFRLLPYRLRLQAGSNGVFGLWKL